MEVSSWENYLFLWAILVTASFLRPAFRGKLISILASRFPDSAHPCEEEKYAQLGVVAAKPDPGWLMFFL